MGSAAFLSLALALGLAALAAAVVVALLDRAARDRRRVEQRFSGQSAGPRRVAVPAGGAGPVLRPVSRGGWLAELTDVTPDAIAAFRADLPPFAGLVLAMGLGLGVVAVHRMLGIGIALAAAALALAAVLMLVLVIRWRHRRRLRLIEAKVPEALDIMVRALRVGSPISASIQVAGRDLTGPIAEEFTKAAEQVSFGKDVVTALRELAERCRSQNLRFLATAVAIQYAAGGNLAEVLDRLSALARQRQQLARKISAMTAEAKWSGRFLSAFPLVAAGLIWVINPAYFDTIVGRSFFWPMLGTVGFLLVLNILFMQRMVRFE